MRWLIILIIFMVLIFLAMGFWGYRQFTQPGPLTSDKTVIVPRGVGIEQIAILLGRHNIIKIPVILSIAARTIGKNKILQAGEFSFSKHISPRGVLSILQNGKQVVRRLTIAEGLTNKEIFELLNTTDGLIGKGIMPEGEGELLPETYYFSYGDSRNTLIKRMKNKLKKVLADLWKNRASDLPIHSSREAIILASIIEKETGRSAERPRIAGVFINRLRLNMKLQSDPTVRFSITKGQREFGRKLSLEDLKTPSPFNTYYIKGLPPMPITNPGRASIKAVMNPANTDELYFVADGTGGHAFSKNLNEHNRNVEKWRRLMK